MRAAAGLWVVLLACTSDDGGAAGTSSDSTSTAETDGTASTSTSSTADTGSESGPPPACTACWEQACADTIEACLADDACACRFGCDNDVGCIIACAASPLFEELVLCIVDETLGSCVEPCQAHCEACLVEECGSEYQTCRAERSCRCRLRCDDGDTICESICGPPSPEYEAFIACYGAAAPSCAMPCAGS